MFDSKISFSFHIKYMSTIATKTFRRNLCFQSTKTKACSSMVHHILHIMLFKIVEMVLQDRQCQISSQTVTSMLELLQWPTLTICIKIVHVLQIYPSCSYIPLYFTRTQRSTHQYQSTFLFKLQAIINSTLDCQLFYGKYHCRCCCNVLLG